jgi:hypothetical protein
VQPFRKFPAILRNPKVHHRVHKSPPLVRILRQFDPVHTIPSYLCKIVDLDIDFKISVTKSMGRLLLENLIVVQMVKKFFIVYRNRKFIIVFIRARSRDLILSQLKPVRTPYSTLLKSPSYHLRLDRPGCLLSFRCHYNFFSTNIS